MCKLNSFILTKWMVSSCVLPSKSCLSCVCVAFYKNNLYPQCVSSIYRYWSFFIILSYSYLTLPEKQSSSAVTWASPGCHVFLKGCLRGTFQIEPLLITCSHTSLHFSLWFLSLARHAVHILTHSEMQFHFFYCLCCHIIMLCYVLAFQLAVISLGADVEFCINCWSTASGDCSASACHSGESKCC